MLDASSLPPSGCAAAVVDDSTTAYLLIKGSLDPAKELAKLSAQQVCIHWSTRCSAGPHQLLHAELSACCGCLSRRKASMLVEKSMPTLGWTSMHLCLPQNIHPPPAMLSRQTRLARILGADDAICSRAR